MNYNFEILNESGYEEAMLGLSLSFNQPVSNMKGVSDRLYDKDGGHNKFLESVCVWLDITMPRYWWQEFSTYRINTSCNSESTMHTITKRELTQNDFVMPIYEGTLNELNMFIRMYKAFDDANSKNKYFKEIKNNLPEGFLQRRTVCTSYKTLRHIISQRKNHKLDEWKAFCTYLKSNLRYKEWLKDL